MYPTTARAGARLDGVVLRLARDDELEAVGALTVAVYTGEGYVSPSSGYVSHLADAATRAHEAELWVAVDGSQLVGSVTFCPAGSPFAEQARDGEAEVRMLGVVADARRRGIAEALMVRCIERSRELGHPALVLCSMREMVPAHRLYQRLGFHRTPQRDWSPAEGVDLLTFTLPLEAARSSLD